MCEGYVHPCGRGLSQLIFETGLSWTLLIWFDWLDNVTTGSS